MSIKVLNLVWGAPPCKGGDLLCLLAIADNADDNGFAYPAVSTIAKKAAMSDRGAQKCLRRLASSGLISVEAGTGRANTNGYQINILRISNPDEHKKGERCSPPEPPTKGEQCSPIEELKGEQNVIKGELCPHKGRTPVHPNHRTIEPGSGGGGAGEVDLTNRERLILAIWPKADPVSGITGYGGQRLGSPGDMIHANRWSEDLGLSLSEQIAIIRDVMAKRSEPPGSFKYFNEPMQRFAGEKSAAPMQPMAPSRNSIPGIHVIPGGRYEPFNHAKATHRQENRPDPALEQIARLARLGTPQGDGGG